MIKSRPLSTPVSLLNRVLQDGRPQGAFLGICLRKARKVTRPEVKAPTSFCLTVAAMGKTKPDKHSRRGLADDILDEDTLKTKSRSVKKRNRKDDDDRFVEENLTRKILKEARAQQEELEEEFGISGRPTRKKQKQVGELLEGKGFLGSKGGENELSEDESEDDKISLSDEQFCEDIQVDEDDEKALEMFMSKDAGVRRTLADVIMDKINEKKTEVESQMSGGELSRNQLDERVVNCFKTVGKILSKYRSGKLPKAFKIVPSLSNWEEILYLTDPDNWTAAAMYQATRIFVSNLNAKLAQRFFNLVLYPRIRDDISEYKRLNYHLYLALKKALFKPAAFFKGILLPLCESGTCTLREAVIIGSVLTKSSIPVLHASAAMLKIAEMDYTGSNSVFLRLLIDKKYALPYRVIDAIVVHFLRFTSDNRPLPVLWHQCLLVFVQRYKEDIASEQKEALLELIRKHSHEKVSPEIRREIVGSKSRDIEESAGAMMTDD